MSRKLPARFWFEAITGAVGLVLFIVTLISREWIEELTGWDPDNGNGSLEILIAVGLSGHRRDLLLRCSARLQAGGAGLSDRTERHELMIGVTGHRSFEMADTAQRVDRLLDEIIDARRPVVVSCLAEGADRMVADLVLARPDAGLAVVLPLPADDYERDFATDASVAEFRALLAPRKRSRRSNCRPMPRASRPTSRPATASWSAARC